MSPARDKKKAMTKVPEADNSKLKCMFCLSETDNENTLGQKLTKSGLTVHYFCLLFASGLSQRGKRETEGLLGFMPKDITRELQRARRLRCVYCGQNSATIGCVVPKCRKTFHFICGLKHDVLNQYFGNFRSYCEEHRPLQTLSPVNRLTFHSNANSTCCICLSSVDAGPSVSTIQAPCCKRAWFHKACIQQTATNAGIHFFKCPLCCNKDTFQDEMLTLGIYIPDQDASWEREPNAFQELLHRHNRCDIRKCFCDKGRKYNKDASKWEIVLCDCCGSSGTHLYCSGIKRQSDDWMCADCKEITGLEEKPKKSAKKQRPPQSNHTRQTKELTPNKRDLLDESRTPGRKRKSPVSEAHAKRRKTESQALESRVQEIIFADTRLPKPTRAAIKRTRHSWHPNDAPPSFYGVKRRKSEWKDTGASSSSTTEMRMTRTQHASRIKDIAVAVTPLPIGKLICMKLLQDRRKTFEILSLSSPSKSQSAMPSRQQPAKTPVIRRLLSQYESPSSHCQEVMHGSGDASVAPREAVPHQFSSLGTEGVREEESSAHLNLSMSHNFPSVEKLPPSVSTSVIDVGSPGLITEISDFRSTPHPNSLESNVSPSDVNGSKSLESGNDACLTLTTPKCLSSKSSPTKVSLKKSSTKVSPRKSCSTTISPRKSSPTRVSPRKSSPTKVSPIKSSPTKVSPRKSPRKSTRSSAAGMQCENNFTAGTPTACANEMYEEFLASIKSCFSERAESSLGISAMTIKKENGVSDSLPAKSAPTLSGSPAKTPASANTRLRRSRSNTPFKTPKASAYQDYEDFLASIERKSKLEEPNGTTPSSGIKAQTYQSYDDFLASIGTQELISCEKSYRQDKTSGRRKSRKRLSLPKKRKQTRSLLSGTSQEYIGISASSAGSGAMEDSDVGYIDCTDESRFLTERNSSVRASNYEKYDCSSELFSDYSDDETTTEQDSNGDSAYLDCNGDNCVSEEVINILDKESDESDDDEVVFNFSSSDDMEIVFNLNASASRYSCSRKCKA